ncbi:MAG: hypothetical protein OXH52_21465 [Gammaproteobacteria bacterium]|nr:hypothetical protein [Gammaproteobacteria bacterium]
MLRLLASVYLVHYQYPKSLVMAQERNVALNPDHPDFASLVTHGDVEPFMLDERLLLR